MSDLTITGPGVYDDLPDETYHADPVAGGSLSCSGAKRLLPPSCPAVFKWERDNGRRDTRAFDFGHAAHKLVLGVGAEIVGVDAADWRTKAAKEQRDEIRAKGGVPLLMHEMAVVEEMAEALRDDPIAGKLLAAGEGTPEASLFARDEPTGVMLRGRLDLLPAARQGRMIIVDYKSAASAEPDQFARSTANFGYHMQAAWYVDLVETLELSDDTAFLFVVQEKTPPYLVSVIELDAAAMRIGRGLNRRAIDLYADCVDQDVWPAYVDDVAHISLPVWYQRAHEEVA